MKIRLKKFQVRQLSQNLNFLYNLLPKNIYFTQKQKINNFVYTISTCQNINSCAVFLYFSVKCGKYFRTVIFNYFIFYAKV